MPIRFREPIKLTSESQKPQLVLMQNGEPIRFHFASISRLPASYKLHDPITAYLKCSHLSSARSNKLTEIVFILGPAVSEAKTLITTEHSILAILPTPGLHDKLSISMVLKSFSQ